MTFEEYRKSIIEDFQEDCKCCGLNRDLSEKEKEIIKTNFDSHMTCFNNGYENAKNQAMELIVSCIYGNNESASIECMEYNTVIIDDNVLLNEE